MNPPKYITTTEEQKMELVTEVENELEKTVRDSTKETIISMF